MSLSNEQNIALTVSIEKALVGAFKSVGLFPVDEDTLPNITGAFANFLSEVIKDRNDWTEPQREAFFTELTSVVAKACGAEVEIVRCVKPDNGPVFDNKSLGFDNEPPLNRKNLN